MRAASRPQHEDEKDSCYDEYEDANDDGDEYVDDDGDDDDDENDDCIAVVGLCTYSVFVYSVGSQEWPDAARQYTWANNMIEAPDKFLG